MLIASHPAKLNLLWPTFEGKSSKCPSSFSHFDEIGFQLPRRKLHTLSEEDQNKAFRRGYDACSVNGLSCRQAALEKSSSSFDLWQDFFLSPSKFLEARGYITQCTRRRLEKQGWGKWRGFSHVGGSLHLVTLSLELRHWSNCCCWNMAPHPCSPFVSCNKGLDCLWPPSSAPSSAQMRLGMAEALRDHWPPSSRWRYMAMKRVMQVLFQLGGCCWDPNIGGFANSWSYWVWCLNSLTMTSPGSPGSARLPNWKGFLHQCHLHSGTGPGGWRGSRVRVAVCQKSCWSWGQANWEQEGLWTCLGGSLAIGCSSMPFFAVLETHFQKLVEILHPICCTCSTSTQEFNPQNWPDRSLIWGLTW